MTKIELLKTRLMEIASSIQKSGHAQALLALGSCGGDQEKMDDQSDLDFFVIAEPGYKMRYIDNLDWLNAISPAGFYFRNTVDGYKYFYKDGVYCEFAVFEESELKNMDLSNGSIVWKDDCFDESQVHFNCSIQPVKGAEQDWMLGELLTNLYVGLCRFRRGEKLSAYKFVQNYAVDQLLQILRTQNPQSYNQADRFDPARRIEATNIIDEDQLAAFIQGYDRTPQSALEILRFVEAKYDVNEFIKLKIEELVME
ncbi:MAG: hypothetical protein QM644_04110 [Mobilitalea sp.]